MIPSFQVCFCSIAWEWIHGIWSNFAYALTLTRSRAGFLCDYFRKFTTQLWPLVMAEFGFHSNWCNLIKLCICIDLNQIQVGIVTHPFLQIYNSYGHWLSLEFCFCSISSELMEGIWFKFAYAWTLTGSRLGLLLVNFRRFTTEL